MESALEQFYPNSLNPTGSICLDIALNVLGSFPENEFLDFYGVHVTQTNVTRLYGKRPPSTKRRLIDPDEVNNLHIAEGATVLEDMYDTNHRYIDLEIKKSDFDALAREITDITR